MSKYMLPGSSYKINLTVITQLENVPFGTQCQQTIFRLCVHCTTIRTCCNNPKSSRILINLLLSYSKAHNNRSQQCVLQQCFQHSSHVEQRTQPSGQSKVISF